MLKLLIIEASGSCICEEVESVTIPSRSGSFTVFPHHAPLICIVSKGEILYRRKGSGSKEKHSVRGGIAHIDNNSITLCVEQ